MINVQCSFGGASCQFHVRQNLMHRRRCCILYICTCSTWSKIATWGWGGGEWGALNKDLPYFFLTKRYPFHILSIEKWYLSQQRFTLPFSDKKVPLSHTVHWKMVPFLTCLLNKKNPKNRKPSCHFCVTVNKLKWYSHKVRFWKHFKLRNC